MELFGGVLGAWKARRAGGPSDTSVRLARVLTCLDAQLHKAIADTEEALEKDRAIAAFSLEAIENGNDLPSRRLDQLSGALDRSVSRLEALRHQQSFVDAAKSALAGFVARHEAESR